MSNGIEHVREIIALIDDFPADGRLDRSDRFQKVATQFAIGLGFIERRETKANCPRCGTPRPDYSYYAVTPTGKMLQAAFHLETPS